ncbi:MAG: LacI family DNA-binding transcriptional regulator [Gulosibacter sp.]|uniref:LacI family DNA-binding transcriptional regulator n=1 Tax=Gulosibacter sp. TaxID=2817531 RepID=UPI003F8E0116
MSHDDLPVGSAANVPPSKRPTIRDVAAAAGVSKSLVSLVFSGGSVSDDRRRRVEDAAEALGYRPNMTARSLAAEAGDFTGILLADLHNSVFIAIVDAARKELSRSGKGVLLTSAAVADEQGDLRPDLRALQVLGDLRPRSILAVGSAPELEDLPKYAPNVPIVLASSIPGGMRVDATVRTDDIVGVGLTVDHLVERGHRHIAHVGGRGGLVAESRLEGYLEAMRRHGLEQFNRVEASDYTEQAGYDAAWRLLTAGHRPTAIIAVNDLAAVGVMAAIADSGIDSAVAVTGYDNSYVSQVRQVSLTSVDPHNAEIGVMAARRIIEIEDGGGVSQMETLIEPSLVVRSSSSGA